MRSTGEVMASAADLPTALAKAERAAGRPLPTSGTAFLSVRDEDKPAAVAVAAALAGLGFELVATEGTARTLRAAGLEIEEVAKVADAAADEPTVVDLVRRGRCDLVVNTPQGSGARADGYLIREAALVARVPCVTTISGAAAAVHAIANARAESALSLAGADRDRGVTRTGERQVLAGRACSPRAVERPRGTTRSGRTRCSGSSAAPLEPGAPGQFFMLEAPGSAAPASDEPVPGPAGRARVPPRPDRPGHARAVRRSRRVTRSTSSARSATASTSRSTRPLLVAGGIGIAPMPYLSEALGGPPALLGFRSERHARGGARSCPARRSSSSRGSSPSSSRTIPGDVLACGPEPMLEALRALVPGAQLAWEAPMACGYGACYGCVVEVDGHYGRLCIDRPGASRDAA